MAETFLPYSGSQDEKRASLDLFFSRAIVFGMLFLFTEVSFLALRPMPVWKWFLSWLVRFVLLILLNYHVIIGLAFKRLSYKVTDDEIVIKSFPFNRSILLKDIVEIKEIKENWKGIRKKIITYAKESPQAIHFVGQFGKFNIPGIGEAFLYATLTSYHQPDGLILIMNKNGKTYGISPERPNEFIKHLQEVRGHS